jgi:hypothetical protein
MSITAASTQVLTWRGLADLAPAEFPLVGLAVTHPEVVVDEWALGGSACGAPATPSGVGHGGIAGFGAPRKVRSH